MYSYKQVHAHKKHMHTFFNWSRRTSMALMLLLNIDILVKFHSFLAPYKYGENDSSQYKSNH